MNNFLLHGGRSTIQDRGDGEKKDLHFWQTGFLFVSYEKLFSCDLAFLRTWFCLQRVGPGGFARCLVANVLALRYVVAYVQVNLAAEKAQNPTLYHSEAVVKNSSQGSESFRLSQAIRSVYQLEQRGDSDHLSTYESNGDPPTLPSHDNAAPTIPRIGGTTTDLGQSIPDYLNKLVSKRGSLRSRNDGVKTPRLALLVAVLHSRDAQLLGGRSPASMG